jgi:FlaA1/EpsC-like NDP-sugar epimerase
MISKIFYNKKVLVTGGSGSIGSGIVRLLLKKKCNVIRVLSNDENGIYELSEKLNDINKKLTIKMLHDKIRYLIGDIRDLKRCIAATRDIDIVIHAAAMKHVPICEYNKNETFKTNVLGTKNLIKASLKNKVKKFLLISNDKAADPTTIMGKSKLQAEKYVIFANKHKKTAFAVIRFGNIIFSRGSVIFKFLKQIRLGKTLTVTDRNVSRFFVSINSAVQGILDSIKVMSGGEIFVLKKMSAFKVIDLAKAIKTIFKKNNKIKFMGLREGEKKYEKIISSKENIKNHNKSNNLALVLANQPQEKIEMAIDSRKAYHLTINEIKKILIREKIINYYN